MNPFQCTDKEALEAYSNSLKKQKKCNCLVKTYKVPAEIVYCKLHAAAPELLEALKNLIDRDLIKDKDGDHYQEALNAIFKAQGKA